MPFRRASSHPPLRSSPCRKLDSSTARQESLSTAPVVVQERARVSAAVLFVFELPDYSDTVRLIYSRLGSK